ncbi:MAG: flagellar motor switch protein FliN [Bryobacteraceae bacterium]
MAYATGTMSDIAKWAVQEFAGGFAAAIEGMAFARPEFNSELLPAPPPEPTVPAFRWKQAFAGLSGEALAMVSEPDALAVGQHVMVAAGVDDSSPEDLKSTFRECLGQAFSILARAMTARLQREVTAATGQEVQAVQDATWGKLEIQLGDRPVTLFLGLQAHLLEQVVVAPKAVAQAAGAGSPPSAPAPAAAAVASRSPADDSKTFDLLLDVELPVSVSFGHAQVPLKDVLKLTTGSIVELSRAVVEPVDIVVNNCVIAKGEVVVVEGNFGVRIQQVSSRNERLRSFQ